MYDMNHTPVLSKEVEHYLQPEHGTRFIDATVNGGGHAAIILEQLSRDGLLVGIDRDPNIVESVIKRFQGDKRFHAVWKNFSDIANVATEYGGLFDGVLFDFGMSSYHMETSGKGFSFQKNEPLDMRYNAKEGITAADILNTWDEQQLAKIIKDYGEERFARRIAREIVRHREKKLFHATTDLVSVILQAVPNRFHRSRIHPATRTFQALRIAVNSELDSVRAGLLGAWNILQKSGRIVAISFHSLEDRIVKHMFRSWKAEYDAHILTKKPITASKEEIHINARARSAKLRAIEKLS